MRTERFEWAGRLSFYATPDAVFSETRTLARKIARWADLDSESGVTAVEYGIMAALIAAALILAVGYLTTGLKADFQGIQHTMTPAT
jgi:pilus assembly protein Flp/PilA